MTRSTNKKILKFSLIPMVIFWIFAYFFPVVLEGTTNPGLLNYIGMLFWVTGCLGAFIWWAAGVVSHLVTWKIDTMELKKKELNINSASYDFEFETMRKLARYGLYIEQ